MAAAKEKSPRSGAKLKAIADMIEDSGLNPTEWEFRRLCEAIQYIEDARQYIDVDQVPPGWARQDVKKTFQRLESDAIQEAKTWREFIVSKRKAVEVDGTLQVPVVRTATDSDVDL